jgi:hypothetical protein
MAHTELADTFQHAVKFLQCLMMIMTLSRVRGSVTNNNGFWIGLLDLSTPTFTIALLITINYENSSQSMTASDSLHSGSTTTLFSSSLPSTVTDLVLIYESLISASRMNSE